MASKPNKLAFLSMPAPASYVAGLGRGASGFTTRSDIGPAREGPSAEAVAEAQARRGEETEYEPEQFQDPDNEMGLFAGMTYEADDEEADKIYEFVDKNMDARRRARREAREATELSKVRAERPKIEQQFADLKRGLAEVTDEEWSNLPEVGNLTRKKRKKDERSFVVPDSILVGDRSKNEYENALDPMQQETGGFETPAENGTLTNFLEIGQARDKILSLKLDQISAGTATSISGTSTSIDPKGYLTDLNSMVHKTDAEIGDIKRARALLDSLIKSNPGHAPGWIAAARTEEAAGRIVAARKLIKAGCEKCPKSEDIWWTAAKLHNTQDAKIVLANAVQHLPQSVKIWTEAANLEQDVKSKKRVLRKALEHIPNSVALWKKAVNLETSITDARVLLARAVEVIPQSVDLWLALARMETPEKARTVLNSARKAIPTSQEIWVAAGRLLEQEAMKEGKSDEERKKELDRVDATIQSGVRQLRQHQVVLTREEWQKMAEKCEEEGSPRTCEAIIKATVGMDLEESDQLKTWIDDANEAAGERGKIVSARAILAHALKVYPDKSSLWEHAANLEKVYGTSDSLDAILSRAVEHCPQAEVLWLKYAKEKWLAGDVAAARDVLGRAFDVSPESEEIWLAAVKLEAENGEIPAARELLTRARNLAGKERIWMKSAVFERQQGQLPTALSILEVALKRYPKFAKFYMIQGQIHQSNNNYAAARASFAAGVKACPKSVALWILSSRLEEADGKSIKSRSLLDKARLANPGKELLWVEAVGVEERSGNAAQAKAVLSRGLQECSSSGLLWTMAIFAEARPTRKARATDALKKTEKSEEPKDSAQVICAIARLFWAERKIEKARQWFERSVATDSEPDWGDSWGWWLKFEREHGTAEYRQRVLDQCSAREPHHGRVWSSIAKDTSNFGKSTAEILELVANALE